MGGIVQLETIASLRHGGANRSGKGLQIWFRSAVATVAIQLTLILTELVCLQIQIVSQVTGVVQKLTFKNTGKAAIESVDLCVTASFAEHESFLEASAPLCTVYSSYIAALVGSAHPYTSCQY